MYPNTRIDKISLINFKNHLNTSLKDLCSFIVLNGNNGSGKTNILEAISLFSPGRGIKNSRFVEIPNKNTNKSSFEIKLNVKYESGEIELSRSFSCVEKNKNYISADNEKITNFQLLEFINILWITPIMEKVIIQSNSEKRNFFDRLIFNINKNHLKNYAKLQKLLSERLALLKEKNYDTDWLSIVEKNIAKLSVRLLIDRITFIDQLNNNLRLVKVPFNACHIDISHELSKLGNISNPEDLTEKYINALIKNREVDSALNKTSLTVNKVEIKIFNNIERIIEAKNCSTGEQKSILLSIFLSVANMVKDQNNNRSPIILIDEAMAHLDTEHKEFLFSELEGLKSQVWFSGVSKDLFENINNQTVFFDMKNVV
jgi:DNA replication and repair protein RecF